MNFRDKLNNVGKQYWDMYSKYIDSDNDIQLTMLHDLCYWEQKKENAISDLEKIGRDFIAYLDDNKKPKHTQPVAPLTNLKTAQQKVNDLRNQLFPEDMQSEIKTDKSMKLVGKKISGWNE